MRAVVALAAPLLLCTQAAAETRGWFGTVSGDGEPYAVIASENARGFDVVYPGLKCGGVWIREEPRAKASRAGVTRYREVIGFGLEACAQGGAVRLRALAGNRLEFRYTLAGETEFSPARAVLEPLQP